MARDSTPSPSPLRPIIAGVRSTLCVTDEGALARQYHDTGRVVGPLDVQVDECGTCRTLQNRTLKSVIDRSQQIYRGSGGCPPPRRPPAYLRRALRCLTRGPRNVDEFAILCEVRRSTAWCYACLIVEHWPAAAPLARHLVHAPIARAVDSAVDRSGTLRELADRLDLSSNPEWRVLDDRYAHLRLSRLISECKSSGRRGSSASTLSSAISSPTRRGDA